MITLFGVLSYANSKESLEEQYKNNAESVLAHTMLTFEYDFSNVETILNQLSQSQILQDRKDSTKDEISELLRMYKKISGIKGNIYYGLENGEIYRSIDIELPDGYNPVKQKWYQLANSNPGHVVWTEPYFHHVTQDIIISALKTVESSDDIQAVLVIDFSLSEISNQISDAKIGESGLVMLLSSSGQILANRDNYMIGEPLFEDSYTQMIEETQTSHVNYDIDEKKYLVHSDTIQQNGMNIVAAISTEEIVQTLLQRHLTVFFVGLICILLFSIITHLAIIREVKPLSKLGSLMSSVENGDYDVHAKINDYKEINRLSNGFNSMIYAIKKRDEDLIISNKELMIAKEKLRGKYEELKESQTILKASEEKVLRLASNDSLTGLLNRRSLLEILTKSIECKDDGSLTAIIFIDLDNFKMINDSLGHSFGDKVIIEVANNLNIVTDCPKDVARISGDEFVVVIHDIESVGQVEEVAKKIINLFNVPITVEAKQLNIMASVGISIYPDHADTSEELLKTADMAMYRAKESGKNRYRIFDEGIKQDVEEKLKIEQGIRESLKANQFELFFQPLYSLKEQRVVSVEALLRTNSPTLSRYNILQIIQSAEVSGQIVEIDQWVLKEACSKIQKINNKLDQPVHISVNISAIHIMQQNFVENVKEIIVASGVPIEWVKFEITETSLMESFDLNTQKLYELQEMGIGCHLDDFGTGYSSLNYLKILPIEKVKIDKSFVDVMLQSQKDSKIVETIIHLAHNIGLQVVAEGVEDKEQFETLENYQCELVQGYYISKPVNYNDIVMKIKDNNKGS